MDDQMQRLSGADIRLAFAALAEAMPQREKPVELWIVGGAVMVLQFGARESTKDVDAFTLDPADAASLRTAAIAVAARLGLPEDWLNDGAKAYLQGLAPGEPLFSSPRLVVRAVAPPQMLAMKLSAWRDDIDIADARLLLSRLPGDWEADRGRS
jgi:hypothetical protein